MESIESKSQLIQYEPTLKPDLAILFAQYYLFVKKQKRDIDYYKEFDELELHDLQYTILLLLNHIGTDGDQQSIDAETIITNLEPKDDVVSNDLVSDDVEDIVELNSQ